MFDKIARHIGHSIEVASYTYNEYQYSGNLNYKPDDTEEIVNVAVECIDCNEVIADVDNENHVDEFNMEGHAVDSELSSAEDDWEMETLMEV